MAGIYPNSDFIICKGVPLEPTYEHTLYQLGLTGQYNMFVQYAKFTLNAQSYQRLNRGVIRVGITADKLYDCNYVMFRNTSYKNTDNTAKWFYAFISSVEYVNDNASDIEYEIDVMQTWYFDYDLGACFVEREHTLTDTIGQTMTQEGVETGDFLVRSTSSKSYKMQTESGQPQFYAVIWYIPNTKILTPNSTGYPYSAATVTDYDPNLGYNIYNWLPMAGTHFCVPCVGNNYAQFEVYLAYAVRKLVEISATIISIQFYPADIVSAYNMETSGAGVPPVETDFAITQGTGFPYVGRNGGYTPKNKKLYQYPYSQLVLSNNSGQTQEYKWELFSRSNPISTPVGNFKVSLSATPEPSVHMYPYGYRSGNSKEIGVTVTDFPTIAWSEDSFQRWWNVSKQEWITSLVSGVIDTGATIATAAVMGGTAASAANHATSRAMQYAYNKMMGTDHMSARSNISEAKSATRAGHIARQGEALAIGKTSINGIERIANSIAQYSSAKAQPDCMKGQTQAQSTLMTEQRMGFTLYDMCITGEFAEIVDNYFTMYGYAIKNVKVPNIKSATPSNLRPYWNYIKTGNCVVRSNNCNADDMRLIEDIYNNGITFWTRPQDVGDYSLNNAARL